MLSQITLVGLIRLVLFVKQKFGFIKRVDKC